MNLVKAAFHLVWMLVLACFVGVVTGSASWALFEVLDQVTDVRVENGWIVWLLPVAALGLGAAYHYGGKTANQGTSLVVRESLPPALHYSSESPPRIPYRMAPMIFGATTIAQLTGASVGREGAALQLGGSLVNFVMRPFRLGTHEMRLMIVSAVAGAFGGAFGVPVAGAIFALEVQQTGRLRYEALAPAFAASITADYFVEFLGRETPLVNVPVAHDWTMLLRLVVVGIVCGLVARAFVNSLHLVKETVASYVRWIPARPVVGAVATLGLMLLFGRDYLGLSLPLIDGAIAGEHIDWWAPVLKFVFTVVALGCSIPGGEVTPLFVIGATLGSVLSGVLDIDAALCASVAAAAVFGAASNTPIACIVLTVELFGADMAVPAAVVIFLAYTLSPRQGIYEAQQMGSTKDLRASAIPRRQS
ncbi:MAG: chloride channel protein [Actinomycetota bacterium]|nr:chloride channel protein [Actinomycetota bacterium]MDA2972743.1 chloride channel protein [Actinomycetota bacterium]MDA3002301.1 chloride channel protein [Actinomycetota bacterium]